MTSSFTLSPFELAGITGFALYVMNYSLLTLRRISGDSITYFAINFSAASLVMIGLLASFNLAAAMVQCFWIVMSTIGIALRLRRRTRAKPALLRITVANSPGAPFPYVRRWAGVFQESGFPDREYG